MEQQENKYYKPEETELFIGYECQACFSSYGGYVILDCQDTHETIHYPPEDKEAAKFWSKYKIIEDINPFDRTSDLKTTLELLKDGRLRTKYLTQEDIESLGWIHEGGQLISSGRQDYTKSNWFLSHSSLMNTVAIVIKDPSLEENYPVNFGSYRGKCDSINELKKIMSWIGVK